MLNEFQLPQCKSYNSLLGLNHYSEQHIVTRRLFNFELELKEYSPIIFDNVKLLISRKNLTAEEVTIFIIKD